MDFGMRFGGPRGWGESGGSVCESPFIAAPGVSIIINRTALRLSVGTANAERMDAIANLAEQGKPRLSRIRLVPGH